MGASRRLRNGIVHRQGRAIMRATRTARHEAKMAAKKEAEGWTPAEPAKRAKPVPGVPYGTRNGERISAA